MNLNKNYILFIIPLLLFLSKWALSYIVFPSDFLITKILFDTPDNQYYPIVKSLANFDFYYELLSFLRAELHVIKPLHLLIVYHLSVNQDQFRTHACTLSEFSFMSNL